MIQAEYCDLPGVNYSMPDIKTYTCEQFKKNKIVVIAEITKKIGREMLYMTNTRRVAESPTGGYSRSPHVGHIPGHARCTHVHTISCIIFLVQQFYMMVESCFPNQRSMPAPYYLQSDEHDQNQAEQETG